MQNRACFMEDASGYRAPDGLTSQGTRTGDRKWRSVFAELGSAVSPSRWQGARTYLGAGQEAAPADGRPAMPRSAIGSVEQMDLESRKTGSEPTKLRFSCFPVFQILSLSGPCFDQSKRDAAMAALSATSSRTLHGRAAQPAAMQGRAVVAGLAAEEALRSSLHISASPQGRSFTDGRLDGDQDHVEAAAAKVAEAHAEDPVLGPSYRWRVKAGPRDRSAHQPRVETEAAGFESR